MKKICLLLLTAVSLLLASLPVLAGEEAYDEVITDALELIRDTWQKQADQYPDIMSAPFVDIKNTRIIDLADKPVDAESQKPVEELEGIDFIIEFMMLTNYYGDTYPCNAGILDTAAVYKSGKMEIPKTNLMNAIRGKYFLMDYSGVIDEIIDLGAEYNGQLF